MSRKKKAPVIVEGVRIERIAAEGKCIGYLPDERVVFVPFTAPGDVVDIRLKRSRKAFAEGVVENMVSRSDQRVEPRCKHFTICGGCKWQHIPYELQLEAKQQQVYDQLARVGHIEIKDKREIIGADQIYDYRNKLEFTFSNRRWLTSEEIEEIADEGDELLKIHSRDGLGFHIPGMFDKVVDIKECHLQGQLSNEIRLFVKGFCQSHDGYDYYDLREHTGFMRTLMIRVSSHGQVMVVVVFAYDDPERRDALLLAVQNRFPEISSLMYVINQKLNDSLGDQEVHLFSGEDHIWEEMEGLRYKIGPKSFYQTNSRQALRLYEEVRALANLKGDELVYDLYTGTGTIASFVSRHAKKVIGIEYVSEAIDDANTNMAVNGLTNMQFYAGDMKDILTEEFINTHGVPDLLITDPPRAGMHPDVVQTILKASPKKVIYVSCNPATQARDVEMMSEEYEVLVAQPVDMFPHTHHVENILLLQKRAK